MLDRNLKYLRQKNKISQQILADALVIPRSTLGDYERGKTEPNIAMLVKMSKYFDITIDELINSDLSLNDYEVIKTKNFRVLAISTDASNQNNIELVDTKAEAGYLDSYQNPEYIKELPKLSIPSIPKGTYRAFEIQGDSMLPIESGSVIIAKYIESIKDIKEGKTFIVITKRDGLVYKRVKRANKKNKLLLLSDNDLFLPYEIKYTDIDEIWQYYAHICFSDQKQIIDLKLEAKLHDIHTKVNDIQSSINNFAKS